MKAISVKRAIAAVALLAISLVIGFAVANKEPTYQGKSLSYWLDQLPGTFVSTNGSEYGMWRYSPPINADPEVGLKRVEEQTRNGYAALEALGPNRLPFLVAELQAKDSRGITGVRNLVRRMGCRNPPRWLNSAKERRAYAVTGLIALGAKADETVTDLVRVASHPNAEIRASALHVLNALSPGEFKKLRTHEVLSLK